MSVAVRDLVAELRALIEGARSKPMSTSAVVNRSELLDLVGRLEAALPGGDAAQQAEALDRDAAEARGRDASDRIIEDAERERERLVGETEVFRVAQLEAARERALARAETDELRLATDDYVDNRLATFEVALTKTLEAVVRGRARLQGRSHFAALAEMADGQEGPSDGGLTTPDELKPTHSDRAG